MPEAAGPTRSHGVTSRRWPRSSPGAPREKPPPCLFRVLAVTHIPWLKAAFRRLPSRPHPVASPTPPPSSSAQDRGRRTGHSRASGPALTSLCHVSRHVHRSQGSGRRSACGGLRLSSSSPRRVPYRLDVVSVPLGCHNQPPRTGCPKTTGCPLSLLWGPEPESRCGQPVLALRCRQGLSQAPTPGCGCPVPILTRHPVGMSVTKFLPFIRTPEYCVRARLPLHDSILTTHPQGPHL